MIKKIALHFIISFTSISFGFAQEDDEKILAQVEFAENMSYEIGNRIFSETFMDFSEEDIEVLPWEKKPVNSFDQLTTGLDSLSNNASIEVGETDFSGKKVFFLEFKSHFPSYIKEVDDIFEIFIKESQLLGPDGKKISVRKESSLNFVVNEIHYKSLNGVNTSDYLETVKSSFQIHDTIFKNINGSVDFLVEMASSYKYLKIKKQDIGKEFTFNNRKYKIVKIVDNKVILQILDNYHNGDEEIEFININKEGKVIKSPSVSGESSSDEITKDGKNRSEVGTYTIPGIVYTAFENNPDITKKEYRLRVRNNFLEFMKDPLNEDHLIKHLGSPYLIFESAGPIEDFYIYSPFYDVKKEFTVEL